MNKHNQSNWHLNYIPFDYLHFFTIYLVNVDCLARGKGKPQIGAQFTRWQGPNSTLTYSHILLRMRVFWFACGQYHQTHTHEHTHTCRGTYARTKHHSTRKKKILCMLHIFFFAYSYICIYAPLSSNHVPYMKKETFI